MQPQVIEPNQPQATPPPQKPEEPMQAPVPPAPVLTSFNQPSAVDQTPAEIEEGVISWTASEFIANQKNAGWYMILAASAAVIGGLVYLLTRDVISAVMVLVALGVIAFLASRQPRTMSYQLNNYGLQIGTRAYPYQEFKSFSVVEEGAVSSIVLMPMKRFMPMLNVYFDPADEERITDMLNDYLPYVETKLDVVERLMRRIRF